MSIIYAPYIDDTIPGFAFDKINIPFTHNPAVSWGEVAGFQLTIKDLNSNILATITADSYNNYDEKTKNGKVTFLTEKAEQPTEDAPLWVPIALQYYKFQLSYGYNSVDEQGEVKIVYTDNISTASIGRCIGEAPNLYIENLTHSFESNESNYNLINYKAICAYNDTEPPYSYSFKITNEDNHQIVLDTKDILHNISNDYSFKENKTITLEYVPNGGDGNWFKIPDGEVVYVGDQIIIENKEYELNRDYKLIGYVTSVYPNWGSYEDGTAIIVPSSVQNKFVVTSPGQTTFYVRSMKRDPKTEAETIIPFPIITFSAASINNKVATHNFFLNKTLNEGIDYLLTYSIVTINGYQAIQYAKIKKEEENLKPIENLEISQNQEYNEEIINGYTNGLVNLDINSVISNATLLKSIDQGETWYPISSNKIDNTIQQGQIAQYRYKLEDNSFSQTLLIIPDFEDSFLSDENKQLKIAFNPKVSSFKNNILESKTDTIDSQYPFFFRNGTVKYKEIPISGLISYHMDPDELFMTKEELGLVNDTSSRVTTDETPAAADLAYPSTQLTGANIAAERKFRLAVLEWLNNGQPKLFRSPTEGNYIVRLMNVSLSPNEQLGRMLYTFSATGYEMAPADIENLNKYNLFLTRE